jgi:hypothetical protein
MLAGGQRHKTIYTYKYSYGGFRQKIINDGFGISLLLSDWFLGKYMHTLSQNTGFVNQVYT